MQKHFNIIKNKYPKVESIFTFGSFVYGNVTKNSDIDFYVISPVKYDEVRPSPEMNYSIHFYQEEEFQNMLFSHHFGALECYFAPNKFKHIENKFEFELKLSLLRKSVSHIASNSWVKARKKWEDGEFYTARKSLFHSIRIPIFGIDIARNGKITEFNNKFLKDLFLDIMDEDKNIYDLMDKYKSLKNPLMTEFRKLAEK